MPWVTRPSICHCIVSNLNIFMTVWTICRRWQVCTFCVCVCGWVGGSGIRHSWFLNSTCIHHEGSRPKHVQVWTKQWGDTNKNISLKICITDEEMMKNKDKKKWKENIGWIYGLRCHYHMFQPWHNVLEIFWSPQLIYTNMSPEPTDYVISFDTSVVLLHLQH